MDGPLEEQGVDFWWIDWKQGNHCRIGLNSVCVKIPAVDTSKELTVSLAGNMLSVTNHVKDFKLPCYYTIDGKPVVSIYDLANFDVGGIIDTSFLRNTPGIGAVLLMSQAGNISGDAVANVLSGRVNPSGKLTDTWAEKYEDYPYSEEFSHNDGELIEQCGSRYQRRPEAPGYRNHY